MSDDSKQVLVAVRDLKKHFPIRRGVFRRQVGSIKAVDGVSFDIYEGETLGLVGESGGGKSTTGWTIIRDLMPTGGSVHYQGQDLAALSAEEMRMLRRHIQMIFQDPYASLNPRMTVGKIVSEPLEVHKIGTAQSRHARVQELLEIVGLNPGFVNRYPHEFSGGQRQRIGVARALATNPDFIVADEPISALDVSIQAQVVNLLGDLKKEFGLTYLFIAHDLSMVRYISDRVAVMYLGRIVEMGPTGKVYGHPVHPYTQALVSAIPIADPEVEAKRERHILEGDVPSPAAPPSGCHFHPRCRYATDRCRDESPLFRPLETDKDRLVACHYAEQFL
ncbi:MAG: dipeptide ABC transporter ATP-binding protein [Chloroflexi bacterium]|nr:dipeptide ABC transporter ATP-binding protein [Chloroflexota bacterium]